MSETYTIIAACPRSGTSYMAKLLRKVGLDIGHEEPSADGVVGWHHLIPSHEWAKEAVELAGERPIVRFHQFRHPCDTIASMEAMYEMKHWPPLTKQKEVEYLFCFQNGDSNLLKAMKLYYHLNANGLVRVPNKRTFMIEQIDEIWPLIMDQLGMEGKALPDLPRNYNSRRDKSQYKEVTWLRMMEENRRYYSLISEIANDVGYFDYLMQGEE